MKGDPEPGPSGSACLLPVAAHAKDSGLKPGAIEEKKGVQDRRAEALLNVGARSYAKKSRSSPSFRFGNPGGNPVK